MSLLLAFAAAVQPAGPAPAVDARPIAGSMSASDYPRAEARARIGGTTEARFLVSELGRVSACEIKQSSRSAALDAAVCRIIQQRFRFSPARDASRRPVAQWLVTRWTWRAPRDIILEGSGFTPERAR